VSSITSPHDKFFKAAMSDIRVAREFFENFLPEDIRQYVDFNKLELCPKSYIDENLKSSESDILYKTQVHKKMGYLYLLAEHQSTADPLMPFHLVDTHKIPDEKLREHHWAGIMAFFMKHIFERDFLPFLREIMSDLRQLEVKEGSNFVQVLLKYVFTTAETSNLESLVETVQEGLSELTGEKMMTIAEQLIERGMHQGMQLGFIKGEHALFTRMLKQKFKFIPIEYQKLVEQADEAKIYKWSENIIDAKTLEEVFG